VVCAVEVPFLDLLYGEGFIYSELIIILSLSTELTIFVILFLLSAELDLDFIFWI
jgi:hypothetical protein